MSNKNNKNKYEEHGEAVVSSLYLKQKKDRLHILLGCTKVMLDVYKASAIIHGSPKNSDVIPNLMKGFGIDEIQAEFICKLESEGNLSSREKFLSFLPEIEALINEINKIEKEIGSDIPSASSVSSTTKSNNTHVEEQTTSAPPKKVTKSNNPRIEEKVTKTEKYIAKAETQLRSELTSKLSSCWSNIYQIHKSFDDQKKQVIKKYENRQFNQRISLTSRISKEYIIYRKLLLKQNYTSSTTEEILPDDVKQRKSELTSLIEEFQQSNLPTGIRNLLDSIIRFFNPKYKRAEVIKILSLYHSLSLYSLKNDENKEINDIDQKRNKEISQIHNQIEKIVGDKVDTYIADLKNHIFCNSGSCSSSSNLIHPGVYDKNDNLILTWDDFISQYNVDISKDYVPGASKDKSSPAVALEQLTKTVKQASQGVKLVISPREKAIGSCAFEYCTSLISITIPNSVVRIGYFAFWRCESLKSIIIPDSVTSIGGGAFYGCSSLASVHLGSGITSLDSYRFAGIDYGMFFCCTSLTNITIPDSMKTIGDHAFCNCSSLTSITIPDSVTSIGCKAFASSGPHYRTSLTSVIIGNSVTNIGEGAFSYCTSLASMTIPDSVTSIGERAFLNCTSLTSITIGNSVTSIRKSAFDGCASLANITIGKSVTSIGEFAFRGCCSLNDVYYTGNIAGWVDITYSNIASIPMFNATNLYFNGKLVTNIEIPNSVTNIARYAFYGCKSIKSVTIPDSVKKIGNFAFYGCESLQSVTISDGVKNIGDCAFNGCATLKAITIPYSVTTIGVSAFEDCALLESITFENNKGWYYVTEANKKNGPSISPATLAKPSTAAKWLTSTHCDNYWKCTI